MENKEKENKRKGRTMTFYISNDHEVYLKEKSIEQYGKVDLSGILRMIIEKQKKEDEKKKEG